MGEHDGHRQRMIERLNAGVLHEHELLEVLLFNALPRRNTNDLAHRLLARFGSIVNVLDASVEQLQSVDGIGPSVAAYLSVVGKIAERAYSLNEEWAYPPYYNVDRFLSFAKQKYHNMSQEVLDFYFIEGDGAINGCRRFSQESLFRVQVKTEEVAKMLLEMQPAGIVVVHNHPMGNALPSKKDNEMTTQIQMLCNIQNIIVCDHIIAAQNGVFSYYRDGRIQEISTEYAMGHLLTKKE